MYDCKSGEHDWKYGLGWRQCSICGKKQYQIVEGN